MNKKTVENNKRHELAQEFMGNLGEVTAVHISLNSQSHTTEDVFSSILYGAINFMYAAIDSLSKMLDKEDIPKFLDESQCMMEDLIRKLRKKNKEGA